MACLLIYLPASVVLGVLMGRGRFFLEFFMTFYHYLSRYKNVPDYINKQAWIAARLLSLRHSGLILRSIHECMRCPAN